MLSEFVNTLIKNTQGSPQHTYHWCVAKDELVERLVLADCHCIRRAEGCLTKGSREDIGGQYFLNMICYETLRSPLLDIGLQGTQ